MEHSYSRNWRSSDVGQNLNTRSIMVHRPPQCPSCHVHTHDEIDLDDLYSPPIPPYDVNGAKDAMHECNKLAENTTNNNPEDGDWELGVNKFGWTTQQSQLFERLTKILDLDRLARSAHLDHKHEPVLRRVTIDKSIQRFRHALGSVSWNPKITQWIHNIFMEHLPAPYLAAYIEILQSLKMKLPTMVDKMLFGGKVSGGNQELMKQIFKKPWEPVVEFKSRKLPNQPIIVIVPSGPSSGNISSKAQKLYKLFATMAAVSPVQCHIAGASLNQQGLQFITEQLISVSRAKIQEVKHDSPTRPIILIGFNAGAALALQIALVETVSCVVCMGFSYNTVHGVRGDQDDHLLDLQTPVLFVIGQNSTRTSTEEVESLREKMQAHTSLVVVGSADDSLRVCKTKKQIEGVTQNMVDNIIMDEIAEFVTNCLINPPGPREPTSFIQAANIRYEKDGVSQIKSSTGGSGRKRKNTDTDNPTPTKKSGTKPRGRPLLHPKAPVIERPQLTPLTNPSSEALDMAIQSILPDPEVKTIPKNTLIPFGLNQGQTKGITSYEIVPSKPKYEIRHVPLNATGSTSLIGTNNKVKTIQPNQFLQLKPTGNPPKIYTLKTSPTLKPATSIQSVTSDQNIQQTIYTMKSDGTGTFRTANKFSNIKMPGSQVIAGTAVSKKPGSIVISPKKFTVMKSGSTTQSTPDLSNTNIFDIPIVFADSDGNIQDHAPITTAGTDPTQPIMISTSQNEARRTIMSPLGGTFTTVSQSSTTPTTILNRGGITINNLINNKGKTNKVVLINRSSIRGVPQNMIGQKLPQLKYTKVNVIPGTGTGGKTDLTSLKTSGTALSTGSPRVEVLHTSIVKPAYPPPLQSTTPSAGGQKFQSIVFNVDGSTDKSLTTSGFKNLVKIGEPSTSTSSSGATMVPGQIKTPNTILIKSGGNLKPFPMLKSGSLLNRNLTVKKILNIVPQTKPSTVTNSATSLNAPLVTVTTTVSSPIITSSPSSTTTKGAGKN